MDHSFRYPTQLGRDEIRLLRVHPGVSDDCIKCDLSIHNLADIQDQYNALSYAWGSTSLTEHVSCNDADLTITANLRAALWQYRESGDSQLLWVDAVCINQNDLQEKTVQVRKMKTIYENAERVIIWIGEKNDDDVPGLELFKQLACVPIITEAEDTTETYLDLTNEGLPPIEHPAWASMLDLLKRPWFYRTWIIQEAIVNQNTTLRCGDMDMPFETVLIAGNVMAFWNIRSWVQLRISQRLVKQSNTQDKDVKLPNILHIAEIKHMRQRQSVPMFIYLLNSRLFEATDPRDKVFSLLGLANEIRDELIDYKDNLRHVVSALACEMIVAITELEDYYPSSPVQLLAWAHIFRR